MRIYHAKTGDPLLIGAESALKSLAQQIDALAESTQAAATFAVETTEDPAPYEESLSGLRVKKGSGQQLTISDDRWLELLASPEDLKFFASLLRETSDGDHRHLYSK